MSIYSHILQDFTTFVSCSQCVLNSLWCMHIITIPCQERLSEYYKIQHIQCHINDHRTCRSGRTSLENPLTTVTYSISTTRMHCWHVLQCYCSQRLFPTMFLIVLVFMLNKPRLLMVTAMSAPPKAIVVYYKFGIRTGSDPLPHARIKPCLTSDQKWCNRFDDYKNEISRFMSIFFNCCFISFRHLDRQSNM